MNVGQRQSIEQRICRKLVNAAIDAGYKLGIHNGEERVVRNSANVVEIMSALFTVDEEHLEFYRNDKRVGYVCLVYGNDGWDVICDYTVNLDAVLEPIMDYANTLDAQYA